MSTVKANTVPKMSALKTNAFTIYFVEATGTELHDQGRICGSLDVPLSDKGERQAAETAKEYADLEIDKIYVANCLFARQTAEAIAEKHRIRIKTIESWQNADHGLWHGKSVEELKETLPKFYRQWKESPVSIAPPEGETYAEVAKRCKPRVEKIKAKLTHGSVMIVAPQPLLDILEGLF